MELGEVAHVDDLEAARGIHPRLVEEGEDGVVGVGEARIVGADDAGGIGDADRRALCPAERRQKGSGRPS